MIFDEATSGFFISYFWISVVFNKKEKTRKFKLYTILKQIV